VKSLRSQFCQSFSHPFGHSQLTLNFAHVGAYCNLVRSPTQHSVLVAELVPPSDGSVTDLRDCQGALNRVTVGNGMQELCVAVNEREGDLALTENLIVVHPAGVLPRLLVEPMGQVPEPWIVDDLGEINHGKVDSTLRLECHVGAPG